MKRARVYRVDAGIPPSEVSRVIRMPIGDVARFERGTYVLPEDKVSRLEEFLNAENICQDVETYAKVMRSKSSYGLDKLAELTGITRASIVWIEDYQRLPTEHERILLASALEIDPLDLMKIVPLTRRKKGFQLARKEGAQGGRGKCVFCLERLTGHRKCDCCEALIHPPDMLSGPHREIPSICSTNGFICDFCVEIYGGRDESMAFIS